MTNIRATVALTKIMFADRNPGTKKLSRKRYRHAFRQFYRKAKWVIPSGLKLPFLGCTLVDSKKNRIYSMDEKGEILAVSF